MVDRLSNCATMRSRIGAEASMPSTLAVVHSDPDILGGTPVFVGTRVPFRNLIDYGQVIRFSP